MTELDRLTSAAAEELTRRISDPGGADPDFIAREFLLWMRTHGWRPTEAKVWPNWKPGTSGTGSEPPAELLAGLRADLDAKAAAFRTAADRAALEDGDRGVA